MHSNGLFLKDVAGFLGSYYAGLAIMNAIAAFFIWRRKNRIGEAGFWASVALAMLVLASLAMSGSASSVPHLPESLRKLVLRNQLMCSR